MTIFQRNSTKFGDNFIEIDASAVLNYAFRTKTEEKQAESDDNAQICLHFNNHQVIN